MSDLKVIAAENVAAVNAHDADRIRATYADDAVLVAPGVRLEGADAITEYVMVWIRAFPDMHQTVVNGLATDGWVVQEWTATGTHTGTLVSPEGEIPPTNRFSTTRGMQLQRIVDGKIAEEHLYFDELQLLEELGLIPEPATA
jgi:steroid delta-isomerase-like uncharacterized protein